MKEIQFYKYQATGNDFVLLDQSNVVFDLTESEVAHICHRRYGVGADGLMILRKHNLFDFEMIYYNSNGKLGSMCGNGGRCIVRFAYDQGLIGEKTTFLAVDGEHKATVLETDIALEMINVTNIKVLEKDKTFEIYTGSPHYIDFVKDASALEDIVTYGKSIRYNATYKEKGINVNLVYILDQNKLKIATYERGVEDETYSCGTGVTAASIALGLINKDLKEVFIEAKGGNLSVTFEREGETYTSVVLTGPAINVYEGIIKV